jgi:hypothetical protein
MSFVIAFACLLAHDKQLQLPLEQKSSDMLNKLRGNPSCNVVTSNLNPCAYCHSIFGTENGSFFPLETLGRETGIA